MDLGGPGRACLQEEQGNTQRPNQRPRQKQRWKGQGQGQEDPWLSIAAAVNGLSSVTVLGKVQFLNATFVFLGVLVIKRG